MSDVDSTTQPVRSKPAKPSPDFPLTPHVTGRWCKKIVGKVHYFGRWEDPEGALREYQAFVSGKPLETAALPAPAPSGKPANPYPEFPLTAHPSGVWCKKIRGKIHYFGPWSDPDGALNKYLAEKDALHAGRKPRPEAKGLTVKALANEFLNHKKALLEAGELFPRWWADCKESTDLLLGATDLCSRSPGSGTHTHLPAPLYFGTILALVTVLSRIDYREGYAKDIPSDEENGRRQAGR